ncbi:MAG: hypothetical protein IPJ41_04295 [Phycisphaerales bacterium]|nr:hypothetical protein [Phycisphaerales bacterium]
MLDLQRLGVDAHNLARVFEIDEQSPRTVHGGQLRPAADRDGSDNRQIVRVDDRRVLAAAVEAEDPHCGRVVGYRVRIVTGLDGAQPPEALQIKHSHAGSSSVACEARVEVRRECDAVNTRSVRDIADNLCALGAHHHDVRTPRHIQAPGIRIHRQQVPAAVTTDVKAPDHVVGRDRRKRGRWLDVYRGSKGRAHHAQDDG